MVKYMTKKQVIADFNTSFSDLFHNMSEHELEHFWDMNLDLLLKNKKISINDIKEKILLKSIAFVIKL